MSVRKTNILLLIGIVALAGIHAYQYFNPDSRGSKLIRRVSLFDRAVFSAESIEIDRADVETVVLRREGNSWVLSQPYSAGADMDRISQLLDALAFGRVISSYTDADLAKFGKTRSDYGLDNSKLKVRVVSEDGDLSVAFGRKTPTGDGVFVSLQKDSKIYVVDSAVFDAANLPAVGFREHSIVPRDIGSVDAFDLKRGQLSTMRFAKAGEQWKVFSLRDSDGEKAASAMKIEEFVSSLAKAEVKSFVWPVGGTNEAPSLASSVLAGYGLDSESGVALTIRDKVYPDTHIVFGREASDGFVYALVHNASAIVTVDGALKDMAAKWDFTDLRLYPFDAAKVTRFAISDGEEEYVVARAAQDAWRIDAPVSAAADREAVEKILGRILTLTADDRYSGGISVSIATNSAPERIKREAILADFSFADLRSREIFRAEPSDVRRIVVAEKDSEAVSVVFDRDLRTWKVESLAKSALVRKDAVESILSLLNPLIAKRIVCLKASDGDLHRYGLSEPWLKLAVDFSAADTLRRNILVGEKVHDGYYAMTGAFDAVFVISEEAVARLSAKLLTE